MMAYEIPVFVNTFIPNFEKFVTKDVAEKYLVLYNKYSKSQKEISVLIEIKKLIFNEKEININVFKSYNLIIKTNSFKKHSKLGIEICNNAAYIAVNSAIEKSSKIGYKVAALMKENDINKIKEFLYEL